MLHSLLTLVEQVLVLKSQLAFMETAKENVIPQYPMLGDLEWVQHGLALPPFVSQVAKTFKVVITQ